jgi:hypothetical protein
VVGTSKQPFIVHKGLLCFYSDFFRAAFEGSFKEATERKIELSDVEVETFEAFQVWLYSQSLHNIEDSQDSSQPSKLPSWQILTRLWVFGDKHQIPLLQNCTIDAMLQKEIEENRFSVCVVALAYENTMHGSPLRKFVIDLCVFRMIHHLHENSVFRDSNMDSWCKEALVDFGRCMSDAWDRKLPRRVFPENTKCHYHVHAEGEHC